MNEEENRAKRPCKRTCFSCRKREALHERAWRVGRDMQADPVKAVIFAQDGFCSGRSVNILCLWGEVWSKRRWTDSEQLHDLRQEAERLERALLQCAQCAGPESEPRAKRPESGDEVAVQASIGGGLRA